MKPIKLSSLAGIVGIVALMAWPLLALGQKAAEQFIPLGKSPGVSNKSTVIGVIEQLDAPTRTLTVASSSGRHTCQITDQTKIWLDRSKLKLTNLEGTVAALQKGRRVEIKHEDLERKTVADWIKVELGSSDPQ